MIAATGASVGNDSRVDRRLGRALGVLGLLCCQAVLLAWSASRHSPTIDEVRWLPAGIRHWQTGTFDSAIVNPPPVRLLAAAPVVWALAGERRADAALNDGGDLVRSYGPRSFWLFTLGRWACIPISLVGGFVCYSWARRLYGTVSGFVALTLWCFCPNILAHGQLISNDCAAAAFGIAATYTFWRWLKEPTWGLTIAAGLVLGLAELAKMSLLVLILALPVVWIVWRLTGEKKDGQVGWALSTAHLCCILFLALDVLNGGYLFEGTCRPLKEFRFMSKFLGGPDAQNERSSHRFAGSFLGEVPVPLPENYVRGLDRQKRDLEVGNSVQFSYLRGQWATRGWWYFYLYALAIKVPLGTWCLLAFSAASRYSKADSIVAWRDEMLLVVPPVLLLSVASSQLGFTDHFRYVLPVLPFAFVWISRIAGIAIVRPRTLGIAAAAALAWSVGSSLVIYPHSLSYFNELVGGPSRGHFHLLGSNIDYGQDLLFLKDWLDKHPEARPIKLAIWNMGTVDPAVAGIEYTVAPSSPPPNTPVSADLSRKFGPQPGWFAVSVNVLHGDHWPGRASEPTAGYFGYFLQFTPVARAGYSTYIYHINATDAERYWRDSRSHVE
jgi:hypothetical protein